MNIFTQNTGFYPTPEHLIKKMLDKVQNFEEVKTVLEPSGGKGDIVCQVFAKAKDDTEVDVVEIDSNLRAILQYAFGEEANHLRCGEKHKLSEKKRYAKLGHGEQLSPDEENRLSELERECALHSGKVYLIHDDFLTLRTQKQYDLCAMNPPFEEGDKHLLKAIDVMKRGGQIVCLLNAETLKNPFTNARKELKNQLEKLKAEIEYLPGEFESAERKTSVEVALIHINIAKSDTLLKDSSIFDELRKAKELEQEDVCDENGLIRHKNYIELAIDNYNLEVEATIKLIDEYRAFAKQIPQRFGEESWDKTPMLKLVLTNGNTYGTCVEINDYLKQVRGKYWRELFKNEEFTGRLTSNLADEFYKKVDQMADYDFSHFNIKQIQIEMTRKMVRGVEETIIGLFDTLSHEHHYLNETSKNIHYYNGWKTNKAHRINKKVIIPFYGAWSNFDKTRYQPDDYEVQKKLSDIEKALDYLDDGQTRAFDMDRTLRWAQVNEQTKNIHLKHFDITFYKKGTCHITFTSEELLEKFNIFGSQRKGWLPPSYGKKTYGEMSEEERVVVDEFQGRDEYDKVMSKPDYYLTSDYGLSMLESSDVA